MIKQLKGRRRRVREMIREIPVTEEKIDDSLLLAKKSIIRILALVLLFVVSARFSPQLSTYSTPSIIGIAGILAFPAAAYYSVKSMAGLFMFGRNNLPAGVSTPVMPDISALLRMPFRLTENINNPINRNMPLSINSITLMPNNSAGFQDKWMRA